MIANTKARAIFVDYSRQQSLLVGAKKIAVWILLAGVLLGVVAASIKILGILPISKQEAMNAFFFVPGAVFLALSAAVLVARVLFALLSQGKDLGPIEEMIGNPPAQNLVEKIILGGYLSLLIPTLFFGGFFAGCWMSLLLSGQIWVLISRQFQ